MRIVHMQQKMSRLFALRVPCCRVANSLHSSEVFNEITLKAGEKMNCPLAITIQESDYLKHRHSNKPLFCRDA